MRLQRNVPRGRLAVYFESGDIVPPRFHQNYLPEFHY